MPLVLSTSQVFWTLAGVLALAGWPYPARGVRAVVAHERGQRVRRSCAGAWRGPWRILLRHLLPATGGFLGSAADAAAAGVHPGRGDACRSWGSASRNLHQAGELCSRTRRRPALWPMRHGCWPRPLRSSCRCYPSTCWPEGLPRRARSRTKVSKSLFLQQFTDITIMANQCVRCETRDRSFLQRQSGRTPKCAEPCSRTAQFRVEKQFCIPPASNI